MHAQHHHRLSLMAPSVPGVESEKSDCKSAESAIPNAETQQDEESPEWRPSTRRSGVRASARKEWSASCTCLKELLESL